MASTPPLSPLLLLIFGLRIANIRRGKIPAEESARTALADLTAKLLTMVNDNVIAKYWVSKGGPDGPLGQAAERWKLRLVLFDAAHELVWPERRTPYGLAARNAKMRKATYIQVHRCATHVLQDALNRARGELKGRLYGDHVVTW